MSDVSYSSAIDALEWNRFLALAEKHAFTEPGKSLVLSLSDPGNWASSLDAARLRQLETQELTSLLERDALWGPLTGLANADAEIELLNRNGVLEVAQLANLRRWLYAVDSWSQIPREEVRGERFRKSLHELPDPLQPLRVLDRVLTPEGELSERASPKLGQLYSEIRSLKKEIASTLDHLVQTFSQRGVLQEKFTDIRDGRYVIPIKISAQNEVEGIIYEASVSRQTVFVEPKEVSPLNNRLRQRQNDLVQEIFVVLQDTSNQLRPYADELAAAIQVLVHWDSVQARARIGRHYGGKPITVVSERQFILRQTSHPLLWWAMESGSIIRNELEFGEPVKTLLVTGPNTGGKTVLLKTLGMAGICARTGFPFPGTDHPTVPFFDRFFADLGDQQSIEQHLSSFSGHIMRFKQILENVSDQSLVLIDELNTATDPEEGAALGRAVLETVMSRGAMVVSTTHDPHLKALAVSDARILNASMAFDEGARTPTYQIVLGVPGRSRALETAERLGLPEEVLSLARGYLSREHVEFERMLSKLEKDSQDAARARKDAVTIREEAEKLKKEWTERTQTDVGEMMNRTRQKLRRILEQAQDEVRASVRKLDEARHRKDLDQSRSQLNQLFGSAASKIDSALTEEAPEIAAIMPVTSESETRSPDADRPLAVGDRVRIPKWKSTGSVLELQGNKAKVAMGSIQMLLSLGDLEAMAPADPAAKAPGSSIRTAKISDLDKPSPPPRQIDLRGTRFEEAMSNLERYLDQAYRSGGMSEVTIIHGLGSGALREGARKLLKDLPYIKEVRDGGPGQGGAGATIVTFE